MHLAFICPPIFSLIRSQLHDYLENDKPIGGLIFLFVAKVKVNGKEHHTPRTKVAPHS